MSSFADLKSLLQRLYDQLDEASTHLRLQAEWKDASSYAADLGSRIRSLEGDDAAVDDAYRELNAQVDLLALARDRSAVEEKVLAREKAERRREDKAISEELIRSLKVYGWLVALSFLATPFAGLTMGRLVVLAGLPAALGYARMVKARAPTVGRHWVILRGDIDVVLDRAAFYDKAAALAVAAPLVWLIFSNLLTS